MIAAESFSFTFDQGMILTVALALVGTFWRASVRFERWEQRIRFLDERLGELTGTKVEIQDLRERVGVLESKIFEDRTPPPRMMPTREVTKRFRRLKDDDGDDEK